MSSERADLEQLVRSYCSRGDLCEAANVAIRGYGPEILGFLVAMHRDEEDGIEAFAMFSEDLWRGLERFSWQCSFRTWAYTLARHASTRLSHHRRRNARRMVLSDCPELSGLIAAIRTETLTYLRTEAKTRVAELREALPQEDKALLILRVDRKLAWNDLARILLAAEEPPTDAALKRESARLRKRFQLVKERLLEQLRDGQAQPGRAPLQ